MSMSNEDLERQYRNPAVVNNKKRVKIYWNRIIIALIILILLAAGIIKAVSAVVSHFTSDEERSVAAQQLETDSENNTRENNVNEAKLQFKICLDAGHGDYDAGTTSLDGERLEKDDNLAIALKVRDCLEQAGAVVIMTRDDDTFLTLEQRCILANNESADLFVSLHRNSYEGDISGVEVWVHNKEPQKDIVLAQNIMDKLDLTNIAENRGVQFGYVGMPNENYHVNSHTEMPSCLLELGFLTDDEDNRLFDENLDSYAQAIADGIIQTAIDLEVIDENGKRLLNEQLVSEEKDYSSENDLDSSDNELDSDESRLVYSNDEVEYYR